MSYATILTDIGIAKLTNSQITGLPVSITEIALGDGNGASVTPTQAATALEHEVYRGQINRLYRPDDDTAQIIAELVVLPNVGGWTVREVGIFDSDGDMIAWGAHPEIYKPTLLEGTGMDFTVSIRTLVGNDANVTLKIDPGVVIATRGYVDDALKAHDADPDAHNSNDLPWIDCGACTRISDSRISVEGDRTAEFPRGKLLRFNGDDACLCRVLGDPVADDEITSVTVWFDAAAAVPEEITKLERYPLIPQCSARSAALVTATQYSEEEIELLLSSYCYSSVTVKEE